MNARLFISNFDPSLSKLVVSDDQAHYLNKVLRCKPGDTLIIVASSSESAASKDSLTRYTLRIDSLYKSTISFTVIHAESFTPPNRPQITLFQGVPKQDKFSDILRMGTEIGIARFVPIYTERAVPLPSDKHTHKTHRWESVIHSAAVQSQQWEIPLLEEACSFDDFLQKFPFHEIDRLIVPWEETDSSYTFAHYFKETRTDIFGHVGLFIGPEGGLSAKEIEQLKEKGFITVSLGDSILRTEHAGFMAASQILLAHDWIVSG